MTIFSVCFHLRLIVANTYAFKVFLGGRVNVTSARIQGLTVTQMESEQTEHLYLFSLWIHLEKSRLGNSWFEATRLNYKGIHKVNGEYQLTLDYHKKIK